MVLLAATLILAATPARDPWQELPPIQAPLGHVGDAISDVPPGGLPADEKISVARYEGCDRELAVHLTRFISGVALGGNQIQSWLSSQKLDRFLFRDPQALAKALDRARQGVFVAGGRCTAPKEDWKLQLGALPKHLCHRPHKTQGVGEFWFAQPELKPSAQTFTAVAQIAPAAKGVEDRCRIRLSAALFDDRGKTRLRYHADYGGVLEVELVGDTCSLDFVFNAAEQAFHARPAKGTRCPKPPATKG